MLFKLAIKYFKNQKRNTTTLIVAIAICTALSTVAMIICEKDIENKKNQFKDYYGNYEIIYDVPNDFYSKLESNEYISSIGLRKRLAAKAQSDNGKYGMQYQYDYGIFDENSLNEKSSIKIVQGRMPEKEGEVIVRDYYADNPENKIILNEEYVYDGETVKDEIYKEEEYVPKEYKNKVLVVGTYTSYKSNELPTFIEYRAKEEFLKYNSFKGYVKLNDKVSDGFFTRMSIKFGCNLNLKNEKVVSNSSYLGLIEGKSVISSLGKNGVLFIICIFSLFVILNAFNISIIERVKQLGTLRAIGATRWQINAILIFEGTIIDIIGIFGGITIGTILSEGSINLLKNTFNYNITKLSIENYIEAYITIITVMIIVMLIAEIKITFGESRITPIEAMNSSTFYSNSGGLVEDDKRNKKDWNIEKKLADKNILGSYKKYLMCIVTLSVGVMMCIFVGNKFIVGKVESKTKIQSSNWNIEIKSPGKEITKDKVENIKNIEGVEDIYINNSYKTKMRMPLEQLDYYYEETIKEITNKNKDPFQAENHNLDYNKNDKSINIVSEIICADKELINLSNKYIIDGKIDNDILDRDKVILINNTKFYYVNNTMMGSKSYKQIDETTKYKVGDKISIPVKNTSQNNEYEIAAIITKNPLKDSIEVNSGYEYSPIPDISIIMGEGNYNKQTEYSNLESVYLNVNELNKSSIANDINKMFGKENIQIIDTLQEKELAEKRNYEYLLWDLILLATLWIVFLLNILNTMVSIVISRVKEIATMRAIGMTKEQLKKNIFYEAVFLSKDIIAVGIFFSIFTFLTQIKYMKDGEGVFFQFILVIILVSSAQIIMSLISALVAIKKVMKNTIVEEILGQ